MSDYVFVPSIRGEIKLLLMVFEAGEPAYVSILAQLDNKLSPQTKILILPQSDDDQKTIKGAGLSERVQVYDKSNNKISQWVRDAFISFTGENQKILIYQFRLVKNDHNHHLVEHLAEMEIYPVEAKNEDWFDVDGGNLLTDRKHIFIGWPDFQRTMAMVCNGSDADCIGKTKLKIIETLNSGNGTFEKVIVIGNTAGNTFKRGVIKSQATGSGLFNPELWKSLDGIDQINFAPHIDMFISLTGQDCDGKPIVFVAIAVSTHPRLAERANEINAELETVVTELKENFCIMRNPMPVVQNRKVYCCYYNNCLVEVSEFDKKVWIPAFGEGKDRWKKQLRAFDKANQQLWESIGFKAALIKSDFHNFCENGLGALHCITNELIRSK
jgi:hypothetical protein